MHSKLKYLPAKSSFVSSPLATFSFIHSSCFRCWPVYILIFQYEFYPVWTIISKSKLGKRWMEANYYYFCFPILHPAIYLFWLILIAHCLFLLFFLCEKNWKLSFENLKFESENKIGLFILNQILEWKIELHIASSVHLMPLQWMQTCDLQPFPLKLSWWLFPAKSNFALKNSIFNFKL